MKYILLFSLLLIIAAQAQAQKTDIDANLVEVAGVIMTREAGKVYSVPYTTLRIEGTSRGTYANFDGMFAIVGKRGDKIKFTAIGYAEEIITIPDTLTGNRWAISVEMRPISIDLNTVKVFPWPDRNNLTAEFLAMNPTEAMQMQVLAENNLRERQLAALQKSFNMDSGEAATYYLHKQARDFGYMGQQQAMPIFDPLVWQRYLKEQAEKKKRAKDKNKEE